MILQLEGLGKGEGLHKATVYLEPKAFAKFNQINGFLQGLDPGGLQEIFNQLYQD